MTDWRAELDGFFAKAEKPEEQDKRPEMARFIEDQAIPAFKELEEQLRKHGRTVIIRSTEISAALVVQIDGEEEISYSIQGRTFPHCVLPYVQIRFRQRAGLKYITVESMLRAGPQDYRLKDITSADIIRNFLDNYIRRVRTE